MNKFLREKFPNEYLGIKNYRLHTIQLGGSQEEVKEQIEKAGVYGALSEGDILSFDSISELNVVYVKIFELID